MSSTQTCCHLILAFPPTPTRLFLFLFLPLLPLRLPIPILLPPLPPPPRALLLPVPPPHELARAPVAQDDLDERALRRAALGVRERELERREPRARGVAVARVDVPRVVQRAARVPAGALARAGDDLVFGAPAQRELCVERWRVSSE